MEYLLKGTGVTSVAVLGAPFMVIDYSAVFEFSLFTIDTTNSNAVLEIFD